MTYRVCVTFLFILNILGAIYITDLTLIIGVIAAFMESFVSFTFPGLFYYISHKIARKRLPWY